MKKPTKASKEVIMKYLSSYYNLMPNILDIEFHPDNLGGYTIVLYDGHRTPGYEFNLFRGYPSRLTEYLNTFE